MKTIPLTKGKFMTVDDEDFGIVSKYKWQLSSKGYAMHHPGKRKKNIRAHRLILGVSRRQQIDHINGDKLDNRRANLRVCTVSENNRNVGKRRDNKSGYKGVCFRKDKGKWSASIQFEGRKIHLGYFITKFTAAAAYNDAARGMFGKFAYINPIPAVGRG